jgi:hypothetical protein
MKRIVLLFALLLLSNRAYAVSVCDDDGLLLTLWETKYSALVRNSSIEFKNGTPAHKLAHALCFLENPGITGYANFYEYFASQVSEIVIAPSNENKYAQVDYSKLGVVELYPEYFMDSKGMYYARASILIHEARHIELHKRAAASYELGKLHGLTKKHVTCSHGESQGLRACDPHFTHDRWADAGPITYEIMFLKNVHDRSQHRINHSDLRYLVNLLLENYINDVSPRMHELYRID